MTRVVETRPLEGCLESTPVVDYHLDEPVDEALMHRLAGESGRLQYFPRFPRPYFRIDAPARFVIQGVLGQTHVRVTFSASVGDEAIEEVRCRIES